MLKQFSTLEADTLIVVTHWNGQQAGALRRALHLPRVAFAELLGVAVRTVAKWESRGASLTPTLLHQAVLEMALKKATAEQRVRFLLLCNEVDGVILISPSYAEDLATTRAARRRGVRRPGQQPGAGPGRSAENRSTRR
ncbi:hypothetical protein KIH74_34970 [Kineosporia sp. J2-2]|uniref:Transcriptional regulator n=1 Tax=Kineosporia corallincola TaxID=2835133 RepID=A0ABS5TTV0_9ACTN|nr:hypothetical protein [Kineosporia corallincola]MBT0774200.1 hypothetical protein [Kineosporia corallincola]